MGFLTDRFGREHSYLRVSLTDRCNFRCSYCMPLEGLAWQPKDEILTAEEIERAVRVFARHGVNKVRLTGGEPTVRPELLDIVRRLKCIPGIETIAMTTNGYLIGPMLEPLREAGLDVLTISLDSLKPDRFERITRIPNADRAYSKVRRALDAALDSTLKEVKLNVVVMSGVNEDELCDFVALTRDSRLQVRFIEFMPFQGNGWSGGGLVSYAQMKSLIQSRHELIPIDTAPTAVGKDFRVEGHQGTIGFVTSMTDSFCGGCNRIRLMADGNIKSCLFLRSEFGLRELLRSGAQDSEIEAQIQKALQGKWKEHPPMEELTQLENRRMIQIGG